MKYEFLESNFGPNFANDIIETINKAIQKGISTTILGMPLSGVATLCRYLATRNFSFFVYLDTQSLKYKTRNDLFLSLYLELGGKNIQKASLNAFEACKTQLKKLIFSEKHVTIIIIRLDYLTEELSKGLLADFKTLADIGIGKIVFIGTSRNPIYQINSSALVNVNPSFMTNEIYFNLYQKKDFQQIFRFFHKNGDISKIEIQNIFELSGGHTSLGWQLLKTDQMDNPLNDPIIKLHLQIIYDAYSPYQKTQLRKIASRKKVNDLDPFLLKIGLVKKLPIGYELFTPLLREYILKYTKNKLPKKERLLFSLLKKRLNKLVTKDEIFERVWGKNADDATDWALNSLIYRLRKKTTFTSKRYIIENEKDEGYRMVKQN